MGSKRSRYNGQFGCMITELGSSWADICYSGGEDIDMGMHLSHSIYRVEDHEHKKKECFTEDSHPSEPAVFYKRLWRKILQNFTYGNFASM